MPEENPFSIFYQKKRILASRSPRRKALLEEIGWEFEVFPAPDSVEEGLDVAGKTPSELVQALAWAKAAYVAARFSQQDVVIIGCDTVAVCRGEILGKPHDREDACRMLRRLSGTRHNVLTGLVLWNPRYPQNIHEETVTTVLEMEHLSEKRLENYLDSGRWQGKAGAFGYQDGNDWLKIVSGTASNVVGLPVERLVELTGGMS
ncbi:MAG: nucleoside triphosphate pyrophosphatase [Planctomycetia bacterium]|nr:nucleoside triphosphate pyrophosphatase [Planctomycetia bacterium]